MLKSKRSLRILLVSLAAAILVFLFVSLQPKTYQGYESLYFPLSQQTSSQSPLAALKGASGEADSAAMNIFRGALVSPLVGSGPQTATGIIISNTSLEYVCQKLDLARKWDLPLHKARKKLGESIKINTEKTGFLRVQVEAESPDMCVKIIEALYRHLQERSNDLTINVSRRNLHIVEDQIARHQVVLAEARNRFVTVSLGAPVTDIPTFQRAYLEARVKLDEANVQQIAAGRLLASLRSVLSRSAQSSKSFPGNLSALQMMGATSDAKSANDALSKLGLDLEQRRLELEDASRKFQSQSAEYQNAKRRLASAEHLAKGVLENETRNLSSGMSPQLARASAQLDSLRAAVSENQKILARYEQTAKTAPANYASVEAVKRSFLAALENKALLDIELANAKIAEARDPSRFEVVDPPQADPDPVGPKRLFPTLLAFFVALAIQSWPAWSTRLKAIDN